MKLRVDLIGWSTPGQDSGSLEVGIMERWPVGHVKDMQPSFELSAGILEL